jgi:hypothetical protein
MRRRQKTRAFVVQLCRVAVVIALLWLIPSPTGGSISVSGGTDPPDLTRIQKLLPGAAAISTEADASGLWSVRDPSGQVIARVARTLPQAAEVVGYRGPTEALLLFDEELRVQQADLLQSADTEEHVRAVATADDFFGQFVGWPWGGPEQVQKVDAVSGATLTSLALAEGILKRIGGDRPSLVFPESVELEELRDWFESAASIKSNGPWLEVNDDEGKLLGRVIRTGPLADGVVGYQGPTELLIKVSGEQVVEDIRIRRSFDNQPYVRYCRMEYGFWPLFEDQSLESLAGMDLEAEGVEGVSGATMTSMAIAKTLVESAQEQRRRVEAFEQAERERRKSWWQRKWETIRAKEIRWTSADLGCALLLITFPLLRARGWLRKGWPRRGWLVATVVVIGLWSGNLISMALVAGWGAEGIAWSLAPMLTVIVLVAFLGPVFGKSNPYCNHLCPHGAVQQLIRPGNQSRRKWRMPQRWIKVLAWLPGTMLSAAYVLLIIRPSTDLSAWEPFHAYLFRLAPWAAFVLAGVSLLFSAFVPMGYCRLGCPTGRLIEYFRRRSTSDRLTIADGFACALLLFAIVMR